MTPLVLFATALLVRAIVAVLSPGPAYPDSYYYVRVAEQLASGNGFSIDYIWSFIDVGGQIPTEPTLPIPAHALWMPLAAIIQVPFVMLLGPGWIAAGLPFWIAGAAAASLTYLIGRDAGLSTHASTAAGLLVAVPGGLTPFLSQPDNFGPFMLLGALALWLGARAFRGDRSAFIAGGLVVGLATLARSDGVLLGLPLAVASLSHIMRSERRGAWMLASVVCAAAFLVVFAPWAARQLEVFGSVSPAASNGRVLWATEHDQIFSVGPALGPSDLLSQGIGPLLESRVGGLLAALGLFVLLPLTAVLAPVFAVGAWSMRREQAFRAYFIYGAALFAASAVLFAVMVPHGFFIHSVTALLPHTFLLVAVGVDVCVRWVAQRRATWDVRQATFVMTYGAVGIAFLGAALQTAITTSRWTERRLTQQMLAAGLSGTPDTDRVMSADPGAYQYLADRTGIVSPNNSLPIIESAMRAYDVRWLALESSSIVPALAPILTGAERPAWLSSPQVTVPDARAAVPKGALFSVCFSAADVRCAP